MSWDMANPRRRPVGGRLSLHKYAGLARTWAEKHRRGTQRFITSWGHGTALGSTTVTFPEGVAFDILCCFVNGIDRTAAYVFPMGYDNRYWAAMSQAADTAAEFEDLVRQGRRQRSHSIDPATPLPAVEAGPALQSCEFLLGDRRLVAVGNFWEEGEAFFRLKVTMPDPGGQWTLREPMAKRSYASPSGKPFWTQKELASGALLHVGKLRWAFLTIEPHRPGETIGASLGQGQVASVMKQRMRQIQRDYAASTRVIADMAKAKIGDAGDYTKLKPLKVGGLSCAVKDVNGDGKPEIVYTRKGDELVIEPSMGARALHWKLDGFDVAYRLGAHSLAVDATWAPAAFVTGEVKVLEHRVADGGMVLKTERTLPRASRGCLPGLRVTRTLRVPSTPGSFRVTTQITNSGEAVKEFAYRHTATPSYLTRTTGGEGWVRLWGEKGAIQFKRNFLKNAYHMAGQPRTPRLDAYAMNVSRTVTEPRVRFGCSWSPVQVEARVEKGKLYKFVFWDSGGQAASTAEFVCRNLKLKPGQSWSVTVDWKRVQ